VREEGRGRVNGSDYQISTVASAEDLQLARQLRADRYISRFPGAKPWFVDDGRDALATTFIMRRDDIVVATLRILPVDSGKSELEELGRIPAEYRRDPHTWELGRMAARRSEPGGGPLIPHLFAWAAVWAIENLDLRRVIAYCRESLLPGFLSLGAQVVDGPYDLAGRGTRYYTVVAEVDAALGPARVGSSRGDRSGL
jgi:hypothetical protein